VADSGIVTAQSRTFPVYIIFTVLFVYSVSRAVVTTLIAFGIISDTQDLQQVLLDCIPACFLCMLQTVMIWKWIRHLDQVSVLLGLRRTTWGEIVVIASSGALVCNVLLAICAATSAYGSRSFIHITSSDWATLLNVYTGCMYLFNGLCFLALGLRLHSLWASPAEADKPVRFRMLLLAGLFGFMCALRGLILLLFLFAHSGPVAGGASESSKRHQMKNVLSSNWGAPVVLICEWAFLVVVLFFLPLSKEDSSPPRADVMITTRPSQLTPRTPGGFSRALNSSSLESLR
jgi:hypothetical protein